MSGDAAYTGGHFLLLKSGDCEWQLRYSSFHASSLRMVHLSHGVNVDLAALLCAGPDRPCHAGEHLSHSHSDSFGGNVHRACDDLVFITGANEG